MGGKRGRRMMRKQPVAFGAPVGVREGGRARSCSGSDFLVQGEDTSAPIGSGQGGSGMRHKASVTVAWAYCT